LKVNMLGLGALAGTVGEAGKILSERIALPITNGTTYAASAVVETVLKAAELRNLKLDKAKVAIIGATNSIGKISAMVLARQVTQFSLVAKNQERLSDFVNKFKSENSVMVQNCGNDVGKAIKDADIIIFTTTAIEVSSKIKIEMGSLKRGAIICDIPVPRNITPEIAKARPDLLVIDGAVIEPPCEIKLKIDTGLLPNQIYACMAETIILTMEGKFESFSCGWEPSLRKVDEICVLAHKHGFKPAFTSFGEKIL
jgi:fatty aldehyde-generating acyl-ACP reductase